MEEQEKFNFCKHRPDEQIEVFDGCPCRKKKKLVYQCLKRSIVDLKPEMCVGCEVFENKQS
jgi:histidinol phosphatase-like enzyme